MIRSGETTDLFINLDCKGFITVKLHFLDPVSVQKIPDREGHRGWDKRKDVCGHTSNGDAQKGQKVQAEYEQLFTSVVTFRRCVVVTIRDCTNSRYKNNNGLIAFSFSFAV
jgi:hypothetical protein